VVDEPFEHGGPSWGLGERAFAWSPDGEQLAGTRNEAGFVHLRLIDVRTGEARPVAKGGHGGLSWVGDRLAAMRSGARTPTQVVVYEGAAAPSVTVVRGPLGGWEALDLPEPEVVSYDGDEGTTVHARLYRPASSATGTEPPPALVWIHGGPTSQWTVDFNARFAYFLDRGWAILVVDHRGSTGFGRAYQQALQGRWGEVDTADVAAAMRGAAAQGDVDGHRLVPIGGSAGGFTVLNLLAHHGDLCAAGVDLFGVADLFDLNETTHRFEAHYLHGIVGPLPAAADAYRSRSPITVAEQITAPLLILQGDNDNVVPPAQSQAIADRLTTLGRTVELHLYEGEGHGWNRPDVVVDELGRIESFLRRHVLEWRA
jgi:dipeptidyl aminopeptidase/acylaminoacyl peptidase